MPPTALLSLFRQTMDLTMLKQLQHQQAAQALASMNQLHHLQQQQQHRPIIELQQPIIKTEPSPVPFEIKILKQEDLSGEEATTRAPMPVRQQRRRNSPAYLACHVCGDQAPNHIHYGGIACFSCRAFFRRSVPKYKGYFCMADSECPITPATRKNCQFCRYQKCLTSGMKASWVLSDKEKVERMAKKRENRAKRMAKKEREAAAKDFSSCSISSAQSSPASTPPLMIPSTVSTPMSSPASSMVAAPTAAASAPVGFSVEEERLLGEWVYAQESTRHTILMPAEIMSEIIRMTQTGDVMSAENIVELFKLNYSRVAKFVGFVDQFQCLGGGDKKSLLSKNLDALSNIRLATCLNADGSGNLLTQLRQCGKSSNIEYHMGSRAIEVEQIFVEPWARSGEHARLFGQTMKKLARHCHDPKAALLFQLVCLFNSAGIEVEERAKIERSQEHMALFLQRYLNVTHGAAEGSRVFADLIMIIQDLRQLADILTET